MCFKCFHLTVFLECCVLWFRKSIRVKWWNVCNFAFLGWRYINIDLSNPRHFEYHNEAANSPNMLNTNVAGNLVVWTSADSIQWDLWNSGWGRGVFERFRQQNVSYIFQVSTCQQYIWPCAGMLFQRPTRRPDYYVSKLGRPCLINKIWWLCLVPTSTTRFASEVGYRMAKI